MIKLTEFKNKLYQIVKPNRFIVAVYPPSSVDVPNDIEFLSYMAQAAKIPEKSLGEIEIKYHGMSLKLPGDYTHEDLSITFLNHYGWEPRLFFENWIEQIQLVNSENTRLDGIDVIDDATITIYQVGDNEMALAFYTFFNIFPKNISAIELDMNSSDQVEIFTVDFAYSHWKQGK
ncbi:hypothetical protein GW796_05955 [archaeon]|nr:hypothetical protein [archaeon]NCQ51428.1 hypothetical protein [archaeon]NCT58746.1 hypothetical protein [archaeon]